MRHLLLSIAMLAAPHAAWHSQQRQLAAAPQSVDEYDSSEQHWRRRGRGEREAIRRRRVEKVSCVALTRDALAGRRALGRAAE